MFYLDYVKMLMTTLNICIY